MRVVLLLALLAPLAAAQPAGSATSVLGRAEARLAAGDSSGAHGLARTGLRDAADDTPEAAGLARLRLRLELADVGVGGVPRPFRQQQTVDTATRLLRLAPADTLALRVLVDDAVWAVLQWHDRVRFGDVSSPYGDYVSPAEIASRMSTSRFDMDDRAAMGPPLERNQRARTASRDAAGWLDTWRTADPASVAAAQAAATLATVAQDWDALLSVAQAWAAASGDLRADLFAGLAHYRLGNAEAAGLAFDRALPHLSPLARARFEDIRPLLPLAERDAYDADPATVAAAFWAETDPRLLTERSERRDEHRARIVEADLQFGRSAAALWAPPGPGANTEQGALWVRYGRPRRVLSFSPGEFGVGAYGDENFRVWDFEDVQFVFDDPERDGVFRTYSPPAIAFATSTSAQRDDFVMRDRAMQRTDPQRTQDVPTADVPLLVSRFRAPGGGTDLIVGFGIPVSDLSPPVRTGAFALADGQIVDRAVQEHTRLASGRIVRSGGAPVWAEAAQLHLSGVGSVRVEAEAEGGTPRGAADGAVEPLPGGFGVSDLLLATSVDEEGRGPVVRDGLGIVPAPRAAFATTDPVYVVLEAYGLGLEDGRTRTTVEATLRPAARRGGLLGRLFGRGRGPGVSVRTQASGARPDEVVSFFIDVRDQEPGRYTLTVTVADETTGRSASAQREVVLE